MCARCKAIAYDPYIRDQVEQDGYKCARCGALPVMFGVESFHRRTKLRLLLRLLVIIVLAGHLNRSKLREWVYTVC